MALTHSISITGTKLISGEGFLYDIGEETIITEPLYIKVVGVSGNKQQLSASVSFTCKESGKVLATKEYRFLLNLEGPNPIKQAYLFLKTLPEISDATDC